MPSENARCSTSDRARQVAASTAVLLASLLWASPAHAQKRPDDIVVMTNGDRLTGEIKGLSKGRLSVDVSATGIVNIKWAQVAALTSVRAFEVETNTGLRLFGTMTTAGGQLAIVSRDAGATPLDLVSIVALTPIRRSFLRGLDGSINVGGSYTQSSGVAQISFAGNVTARRPSFEWRFSGSDYVTFKSEGPTTQRVATEFGYSWYVTRRWALFGGGQVERNPDLGFDLRGTAIGGLEGTLLRTNRNEIVVGGGLGASREVPVEGDTDTLLPAMLSFRQSFFTYSTPKTAIDTKFSAFPILNQRGRWRLEATASVSRELFKDFSVAFTVYESFDNRPPSANARRNDFGATLSIGFIF